MSSGLPYLRGLRKAELTDFAETTNMPDYSGLKKTELEVELDKYLQANSTTYSKDPSLSDYYKRLGVSSRSPLKKLAEKVSDIVKSDDDAPEAAPVKKARRKTRSPEEMDGDSPLTALIKTPGKEIARKSSILASSIPLPPSPAVVTDAIDAQTKRIRTSISHAYDRTQIHEYSDSVRDSLSSTVAINVIAIVLEAYGLRQQILPNKLMAEVASIPYIKSSKTSLYVPDLFLLLDKSFWAPFTLWILTTIALPAMVSYFINLPLKQFPSHGHATRKASIRSDPKLQFDPFIFNLAKGLVAYLVLGCHFSFAGLYDQYTISQVNVSMLGGYSGLLISSGLGAAVSLYEAVLNK